MKRSNLMKDAIVIAFGWTVGKKLANFACFIFEKKFIEIGDSILVKWAKKGNPSAQEYCKKWHVDYEEEAPKEDNKED